MASEELSEEDLQRLAQAARDTLARCRNCAQTSFAVLQDEFNLEGGPILKALTPFPGIALRGETCGAVVGSLMAIGLVYGRDDLEDWHGYIGSLPPARRFTRRFEELNASTECGPILEAKLGRKFNLADTAQSLEYVEAGGPQVCGEILAGAVGIAAQIIAKKTGPGPNPQQKPPAA
jgi:C_GCAxxG_C_C family probable redox protein